MGSGRSHLFYNHDFSCNDFNIRRTSEKYMEFIFKRQKGITG
jgi:hypothetical protein